MVQRTSSATQSQQSAPVDDDPQEMQAVGPLPMHILHTTACRQLRAPPSTSQILFPAPACRCFKSLGVIAFCDWLRLFNEHATTANPCCILPNMRCLQHLQGALNSLGDPTSMLEHITQSELAAQDENNDLPTDEPADDDDVEIRDHT